MRCNKLIMMGILLSISVIQAYSTTYYVSNSGSDNADGSSGSPFKTISKAASVTNPGDIVLISEGTYSEKDITPISSGTEGNYIVFRPKTFSDIVVVKHPATSDDQTPIFQLSNRDYIWIEGLQFKDFNYGLASIFISSGTGNVVTNNRFENLGNTQVGAWNGNQMVGIFNGVKNVVFNNYFNNIIGDGINVNSRNSHYNFVCYNTFKNFEGKLRSWGGSHKFSRAIDVKDMSNGNNFVAFNYAEDVVHHVWLDRNGSSNIILRNYGNGGSGNVFNESRCSLNVVQENISVGMKAGYMSAYYSTTDDTYGARIINNVAYNNQIGFRIHKSHRDEMRNNISYNNSNVNLEFSSFAADHGPHIFRNNLWYTSGETNSIGFRGSGTSVSDFQSQIGETNGLSENPLFMDLSSGYEGFVLQSSSPALGAGDNGLDIGAYAYYGPSQVGWNENFSISDVVVYFDTPISRAERDESHEILLRLNKASTNTVTVNVSAIAGDAIIDEDFAVSGSENFSFAPGETEATISLQVAGSSEHDELVALKLVNASNANVGARCVHALRVSSGDGSIIDPKPDSIPGRVEAEEFSDMSGIRVESDPQGNNNIGMINSGNWAKYLVDVQESCAYVMRFNVGTAADVNNDILVKNQSGTTLGTLTVDASLTDDWKDWYTDSIVVNLEEGEQDLTLEFDGSSEYLFNVNWFELYPDETTAIVRRELGPKCNRVWSDRDPLLKDVTIFVQSESSFKNLKVTLYSISGRKVFESGVASNGQIRVPQNQNLRAGLYYIVIFDKNKKVATESILKMR